jgi:hypothetical protein
VRSTAKLAKQLRKKASKAREGNDIITRAEWQIIRRSRRDIMRLPAFAVLVLVFGEWLPLFVLFLTPLVPEACRIPAQVKRDLEKKENRRRERGRRLALDAPRLIQADRQLGVGQSTQQVSVSSPRNLDLKEVEKLDGFTLLNVSTKLDVYSRLWDWLFVRPPKPLLKWELKRKLAYLKKDDELLERDGGWQGLGRQELERASVERGIDVLGKSEADLRKSLAQWFGSAGK